MSETNTQSTAPEATTAPVPEVQPEVVPKDVYDRTKADMFKAKAQLDEMKRTIEELKINRLKETQNWEEVAKAKESEAKIANDRLSSFEQAYIQAQRESVLKNEAVKAGMIDLDLLGVLDMPEVQVETTSSGKIIVHGASAAIQSLKVRKPHLFNKQAPSINPQTPEVVASTTQTLDVNYLMKLEAEYKKNPSEANKKTYYKALMEFKNKK